MKTYYELHLEIKQDKLCPIHYIHFYNLKSSICNWHRNIEVIRFEKDCILLIGDREYALHQGDMAVVNTNALHQLHAEEFPDFYTLLIDADFCIENGIDTDNIYFTPVFHDPECFALHQKSTEAFLQYKETDQPLDATALRIALLQMLSHMCKYHTEPVENIKTAVTPAEEYVKTVIGYLTNHYAEQISLDALAKMCGITKYHLTRKFRDCTTHTIMDFLNALRCRQAETFLRQGLSVTETAEKCGFDSIAYFSRTYKKYMGISPSQVKS